MQIIDNKALLLRVRNPNRITTIIPKSTVLESGEVLVRWGIEEAQVLKNLQIKNVPSPIIAKYDWPGLYSPFMHQKVTSAFLTLHRRAFCFNEQGLGKTMSVIWAADYLMNIGLIKRVLVLCPLSIMQSAWQADLFNSAMHRTVAIAHNHNREKRKEAVTSKAEFVICNFDGLEIVKEEVKASGFDLIVVDEANYVKTVATDRWRALNSVITPSTWVWMMTGTPAAQSPLDAYGLAKIINPSGVPKFFGAFKDVVMQKVTTFKWIPRPNSEKIVHEVLQPAIRFTKEECLDIPDMMYITRDIPLTTQQVKYYELLRKNMMTIAAGEEITTVNAATNLNKLLQISSGAAYTDNGETVSFDMSTRFKALKEVIKESSHKVIVFVPFTHTIQILHEQLNKEKYSAEVINGAVPVGKRTSIFKQFQEAENPKVLIIQPQAASHGVTLHAANTVVWWGPITSIETYLQANARVHRAGQRNPCTVVHLQGSHVEKKVYKMLREGIDIHSRMIDLYKNVADNS